MTVIDLVLFNSADCELGRFEVQADDLGDINLPALTDANRDLRLALEMLAPGDSLRVVERWTEGR